MPVAGFGAPALALSGRVATERVVRATASGHAVAEIRFLGPATRVASRECGAAGPRNDTSVFIRRVRAPLNDSGSHDSLPVHTELSHLVSGSWRRRWAGNAADANSRRRSAAAAVAGGCRRLPSFRLCSRAPAPAGTPPALPRLPRPDVDAAGQHSALVHSPTCRRRSGAPARAPPAAPCTARCQAGSRTAWPAPPATPRTERSRPGRPPPGSLPLRDGCAG
jgi:hypothetical protein